VPTEKRLPDVGMAVEPASSSKLTLAPQTLKSVFTLISARSVGAVVGVRLGKEVGIKLVKNLATNSG
jgi:hypothetical protein